MSIFPTFPFRTWVDWPDPDSKIYAADMDDLENRLVNWSTQVVNDLFVRNVDHPDVVNDRPLYISETGWNPLTQPVPTTTTPNEHANLQVGGIYDEVDGGGGIEYLWGMIAYMVNTGTAPISAALFKSYGWKPSGLNAAAWALGNNGTGYGIEISVGCGSNQAIATLHLGSTVLTDVAITLPGSLFEGGNILTSTTDGIPAGAVITDVDTVNHTITINVPVTVNGTRDIRSNSIGQSTYGLLITGVGAQASVSGPGNPDGRAIHIQAYGDDPGSAFKYGLSLGASSLRPDGTGVRLASMTAQRGVSFESATLQNGIYFSNDTLSDSGMAMVNTVANYGVRFSNTNTFSIAAIYLEAQNIGTDTTTGMKIATNASQKIGFYGKTPIAKQTVTGAKGGNAALTDLLNKLVNLGIITDSTT